MSNNLPLPVTGPFSNAQRTTLINLVRRAVQAEILPRFRRLDRGQITAKSGPMDLVTQADTAAEAMITRGLQIAFPHAVIVGEETAGEEDAYRAKLAEAELGFLIDPVDGTWNFAHGLPVFGTMVAACRFGRPVFALIYDPLGHDFLWADIDSETTWVSQTGVKRPQTTRAAADLNSLIGYLELGFMPSAHRLEAAAKAQELAHVTTLRCAAHQYRLLAQGSVDFFLATKLAPWDHAAGALLCQKAGGHAAFLDGSPNDTTPTSGYLLCASNEKTWTQVAEHFAALKEPA